jgi:hypothetical protein
MKNYKNESIIDNRVSCKKISKDCKGEVLIFGLSVLDLMLKLEKIVEVWNGNAYLHPDENGFPVLNGWYQMTSISDRIDISYKFINNEWILLTRHSSHINGGGFV